MEKDKFLDFTCCPRCRSRLERSDTMDLRCSNGNCQLSVSPFLKVADQPVLINFEDSIFRPVTYVSDQGYVLPRDNTGRSIRTRVRRFMTGGNEVADSNGQEFLRRLKLSSNKPRVLVIGGGAIGDGAHALYGDTSVEVIGTDVYASPYTCAIVDGHQLPFVEESFDGVWVQAVLEHVLDPYIVVAEIFRVLRPQGLVYSEIPFMQQVHEAAYDFTRFTLSGHRWLFRRFAQIKAGSVGGAGTACVWSFRWLCRALGASNKVATILAAPLFWLRFLDARARRRPNADAASGTYFLGIKSDRILKPSDMVEYYESQLSEP
jgi:SAM-dependent methyltransferase